MLAGVTNYAEDDGVWSVGSLLHVGKTGEREEEAEEAKVKMPCARVVEVNSFLRALCRFVVPVVLLMGTGVKKLN